jgi:phage tail sheath gpL-like
MAISFNEIPSNIRVPLFYAEFDNSRAVQGLALQVYKALIIGQKTSAGSATVEVPVLVTSADQAKSLFGVGSMLHRMFVKWFKNNKSTEVWAIPVADNGSGVAATGTFTVTGPATAAGTLSIYIGGQLVQVAVASGDAQNDIAAAINAAINAATDLPVTSGVSTNVVTVTAKNKGTNGNKIDLRLNYQVDEATPAGVSVAIVAMASGATNPVLTNLISAMGEEQYHIIANPYVDATSLTALEAELLDRWGPIRQNEGVAIAAASDTVGNLTTLGNSRNSKHSCIFGAYKYPTPPEEIAAAIAGVIALQGAIDPARPFQTLQLAGVLPPSEADRFVWSERNTLLFDGIASLNVGPGSVVQIERAITTYQLNAFAVPDISYLDVNVLLTLSYLRYSFKARMTSRYPRHKLAKDGTRFGPGQAVITPKVAKAECFNIFKEWELKGLVEGFDQFKNDLIVEINSSDPNRLDIRMSPDLINQLVVLGVQIQYLL